MGYFCAAVSVCVENKLWQQLFVLASCHPWCKNKPITCSQWKAAEFCSLCKFIFIFFACFRRDKYFVRGQIKNTTGWKWKISLETFFFFLMPIWYPFYILIFAAGLQCRCKTNFNPVFTVSFRKALLPCSNWHHIKASTSPRREQKTRLCSRGGTMLEERCLQWGPEGLVSWTKHCSRYFLKPKNDKMTLTDFCRVFQLDWDADFFLKWCLTVIKIKHFSTDSHWRWETFLPLLTRRKGWSSTLAVSHLSAEAAAHTASSCYGEWLSCWSTTSFPMLVSIHHLATQTGCKQAQNITGFPELPGTS